MAILPEPDVRARVEALLEETHALRTGKFVLSSGKHSNRYCQCATLFERPAMGREVAARMADLLRARGVEADAVVAPALGGVLWGYELAAALERRSLFVERKDGVFEMRRGFALHPGERVLLAEDVITTGKSVEEVIPIVKAAGAEVVGFASIVDRSRGGFAPAGIPVYALVELAFDVWDPSESPFAADEVERPGSRGS
ncbi:MAG: orotate phosphoribosyltransferase [Phycisphaerales bacterium]|nr:orotate phosphoribosyltransferase [Phycisphaerales bacterium]